MFWVIWVICDKISFSTFKLRRKETFLDQFDPCFLFQLLKLRKNSWKHRMNLLGDKKFFWYIPVIPWGQGGWHVCWRLLFLLYNVFITDRTEAVCTIVWIETAPIAAQYRMLFHVVWFLIHFVLWFFLSCFSCFQVSQMTFSADFTSLSANENKFWH